MSSTGSLNKFDWATWYINSRKSLRGGCRQAFTTSPTQTQNKGYSTDQYWFLVAHTIYELHCIAFRPLKDTALILICCIRHSHTSGPASTGMSMQVTSTCGLKWNIEWEHAVKTKEAWTKYWTAFHVVCRSSHFFAMTLPPLWHLCLWEGNKTPIDHSTLGSWNDFHTKVSAVESCVTNKIQVTR